MQTATAEPLDAPIKSPGLRIELLWLISLGIVVLATAVRFWRLPDQLFIQVDDAWHIALIQRFAHDNILDYTQARPMYVYIVGRMARLVDASPFFAAQVSAVSGALLVAIVLLWTQARAGTLAGLTAGLVAAVSELEIYFSKASSPIAPAMFIMTLAYVCVGTVIDRQKSGGWPSTAALFLTLSAGVVAGLAVTIHRAFLPVPFFLVGFLLLTALRPAQRRSLVLVVAFVLATLLPVLVAQIVTERHQPPNINHFGYLNQLKGSFEQQSDWRSGPGGRGWLFYLVSFWETEGPLSSVLAISGLGLGLSRWLRDRDWWSGLLTTVVLATFGYASIVSAGGGITVLRAMAPALPVVSVLSGIVIAHWCWMGAALVAGLSERRLLELATIALGALGLSGLALAWPVINAQTGFLSAMELVHQTGGY
ncbi:MAG TPA: hypothetical protein VHX16_15540, partial [Chloroflexota bacterium]|nr:hypothetical protein [Chloroflexota bacterium]